MGKRQYTKIALKKKKKQWFTIVAPREFNEMEIGESLAPDTQSLVNRRISLSLGFLTGDLRRQNTKVLFRINEIKNDKCSACGYSKKKKSMIGEFKVPFEGVTKGFKEIFEPIRMGVGGFRPRKEVGGFMARELKKAAEGKAKGLCFTAYEIYKKAHGMLTW